MEFYARICHTQNSTRNRRRLINALGSIIKAITENLHQEDAQNYRDILNQKSNNQFELKNVV